MNQVSSLAALRHAAPQYYPTDSTGLGPLVLCYLLGTSSPSASREINMLRTLGHSVHAVTLTAAASQPDLAANVSDVVTLQALTGAVNNPSGVANALAFAQRQTLMPRRALLREAARVAFTASARGCVHIHADTTGVTAAVAICAARIAGCTTSLAGDGGAAQLRVEDLAMQCAAADVIIAADHEQAELFRKLAPRGRVHTTGTAMALKLNAALSHLHA